MWFEGTAVDFKVGDVKTNFHTLQVCVSAEQSRLEKLQEENQLWETKQVSQTETPVSEPVKVGPKERYQVTCDVHRICRVFMLFFGFQDSWKSCAGNLPSEDGQ